MSVLAAAGFMAAAGCASVSIPELGAAVNGAQSVQPSQTQADFRAEAAVFADKVEAEIGVAAENRRFASWAVRLLGGEEDTGSEQPPAADRLHSGIALAARVEAAAEGAEGVTRAAAALRAPGAAEADLSEDVRLMERALIAAHKAQRHYAALYAEAGLDAGEGEPVAVMARLERALTVMGEEADALAALWSATGENAPARAAAGVAGS